MDAIDCFLKGSALPLGIRFCLKLKYLINGKSISLEQSENDFK